MFDNYVAHLFDKEKSNTSILKEDNKDINLDQRPIR